VSLSVDGVPLVISEQGVQFNFFIGTSITNYRYEDGRIRSLSSHRERLTQLKMTQQEEIARSIKNQWMTHLS
jgi:hypothetical protein